MISLTRFVAVVAAFGCTGLAAWADGPDTKKLIAEVDATTRAVDFVTYSAKVWVEGDMPVKQPRIEATVAGMASAGGSLPMLRIEGRISLPDSDEQHAFKAVLNDKYAATFNMEKKTYVVGTIPEAVDLVTEPMHTCVMREFLHPTPFTDELEGEARDYEGRQTIGGVDCHVIMVTYRGGTKSRWYFGVEDKLPHRVDRIHETSQGMIFRALELYDVNVKDRPGNETFEILPPEGFTKQDYKEKKNDSSDLLEVGSEAPDWALKNAAGETVLLSELRGKLVLLDFWATWCGPCKLIMPKLQKLHEEFKDKPIEIYGVNTWERGDPVAYMKEKQYTFGLLLKGDKVAKAYHVRGIPTMYLIGPDGKILHATTGVSPTDEKKLTEIIKSKLSGMGR